MDNNISEDVFLSIVLRAAKLNGWKVAHFRPAKTSKGWRTPVQGDGKGFPDLVLARKGSVIFAELKSEKGELTHEQKEWHEVLSYGDNEAYIWRPRDWNFIIHRLEKTY